MKTLTKISLAVTVLATLTRSAVGEAAKTTPGKPTVASRSMFVQPANAREGRDPFYPESLRPFESAAAVSRSTVEISALSFKGVLGTPGHYVAIINNHAFALGDEGDVRTPGGKARVRCLEIRPRAVVIEINGQRHELNLISK